MVSSSSSGRVDQQQEALIIAMEGDEAIKTIDFDDIPITGTGLLAFSSGQWSVSGSGPEIITGGFTRSIEVSDVYRDVDCNIVESGGTLDTDSKSLEIEVEWTDIEGRSQEAEVESLITRWDNPQGSCFTEEASQVVLDIFTDANWHGQKQLRDVYVTNNGTANVTIDKITMTWDNAELIDQFFMDNKVWSDTGPGTPSGSQPSGTELDIQDRVIAPSETSNMNKVQFLGNMLGTTLTIKLEFSDGSFIQSDPFTPTY